MSSWSELLQDAALSPEQETALKQQVAAAAAQPTVPLWLKGLAAIAGWIACFFLVPFIALFNVYESPWHLGFFGVVWLAVGVILMRFSQVLFVHHLALAFSLLGTGMVVWSVADADHGFALGRLLLVQAIVAAIGYVVVPSSAYRFLVCANTAFLMVCWLMGRHNYAWMPLWMSALAVVAGVLWVWRARPLFLNPLAYASLLSLAGTVLFDLMLGSFRWWDVDQARPQWTSVPIALVFLGVIACHTGGVRAFAKPWMWGACLLAALGGVSGESGLMIALLLLVVSFAWDDRLLAAVGYLFLAGFLFMYYYSLQVPLYSKSWIVGGTGVLLLGLRWILHLLERQGGVRS